jgi:beta-1,4-mannosyltransferase
MMLTRFLGQSPKHEWDDALRTLTYADWTAENGPIVVSYSPQTTGNPFQRLLYQNLSNVGSVAVPGRSIDTSVRLSTDLQGSARTVTHLHWLNVVLAKCKDRQEARAAIETFTGQLDNIAERDGQIIWTVHNILPHEAQWEDLEAQLRTEVAQRAQRIHIMSSRTPDLCEPYFHIPREKVVHIPHPSYEGVYPHWVTADYARQLLGIPSSATVFLAFGRMLPYKGSVELLQAFTRLSEQKPGKVMLIVAGAISQDAEMQQFLDDARYRRDVLVVDEKIPEVDVQIYFRAADVCAYPYRRSLNSGALTLGLTFGRPAILPDNSGELEDGSAEWVEHYDPSDEDGLFNALSRAMHTLTTPQSQASAIDAITPLNPTAISQRYVDALQAWLGK